MKKKQLVILLVLVLLLAGGFGVWKLLGDDAVPAVPTPAPAAPAAAEPAPQPEPVAAPEPEPAAPESEFVPELTEADLFRQRLEEWFANGHAAEKKTWERMGTPIPDELGGMPGTWAKYVAAIGGDPLAETPAAPTAPAETPAAQSAPAQPAPSAPAQGETPAAPGAAT